MMNKLTKVGEISATMQEMQKEMMKVRAQPRRGCSGAGSGSPAGAQVGIAQWFACLTLRRALSQAGVIEEMVDDAMEALDDEADEEEADVEVERVMQELNAENFKAAAHAPTKAVAQPVAAAQEEEEEEEDMAAMRDRLAQIKA